MRVTHKADRKRKIPSINKEKRMKWWRKTEGNHIQLSGTPNLSVVKLLLFFIGSCLWILGRHVETISVHTLLFSPSVTGKSDSGQKKKCLCFEWAPATFKKTNNLANTLHHRKLALNMLSDVESCLFILQSSCSRFELKFCLFQIILFTQSFCQAVCVHRQFNELRMFLLNENYSV